jgi:hypothetical protein
MEQKRSFGRSPHCSRSRNRIGLGRSSTVRASQPREILANWWYFWWYGSRPEQLARALRIQNLEPTAGFEPATRCLQISRQLNSARVFGFPCIHKGSIRCRSFHWRGYNGGYRNEAWKSRASSRRRPTKLVRSARTLWIRVRSARRGPDPLGAAARRLAASPSSDVIAE